MARRRRASATCRWAWRERRRGGGDHRARGPVRGPGRLCLRHARALADAALRRRPAHAVDLHRRPHGRDRHPVPRARRAGLDQRRGRCGPGRVRVPRSHGRAGGGGEALAETFAVARDHGVEAHGIWTVAELEHGWELANEGGGCAQHTDAFMKVICIAPRGRSGYASQAAVAVGDIRPRELAERAAGKAVFGSETAGLPPGEYPVVFEPQATGWLLDLLAGCAFNGLAHAEGRGALDGRLGERVAAVGINLSDSPGNRRTLAREFDAEGTRKAPIPLIQNGVAHGVAHDIRSAALAGGRRP